jgi:hypothetical protein
MMMFTIAENHVLCKEAFTMTTEELAELFMVSLYDVAEAAPHPYFLFTMNEFAPRMGISDLAELRKALNFLEEKGLIYLASTDAWGGVSAGITMEGSVFVEHGGDTGIIERYRKDPSSVGIVPQSEQPAPALRQTTPEPPPVEHPLQAPSEGMLEAVLAEMVTAVENEATLEPSARRDLFTDIGTLKIQLSKQTKNQAIIMAILDNLANVAALAPLARLTLRLTGEQK